MGFLRLNFICTKETFNGTLDANAVSFDAYKNYELLADFLDSCPDVESFTKEEYFDGDWYEDLDDYVICEDGKIVARAGIREVNEDQWEVVGVVTRPEYRKKGYSVRRISHCIAKILEQGKVASLSVPDNNYAMIGAAKKAGFILQGY